MKIKTKTKLLFLAQIFLIFSAGLIVFFLNINQFSFLKIIIYLILFIFTILCSISYFHINKNFLNIFNAVIKTTQDISSGNLKTKINENLKNEFGQLENSFNHMMNILSLLNNDMQKRVEEQSDELDKTKKAILNLLEDLDMEKKNIAQEKAKDEALLKGIGEGIIAIDKSGKIIFINTITEKILGRDPKEMINKYYFNVLNMENEKGDIIKKENQPIEKVLKNGKKIKTNTLDSFYYVRKNKTRFPAAITITPIILNGKIIGAINVFRDITQEKEIDRSKTEFVSLASHQLRTPLASVKWYTEMLLEGDAGQISDEQKKYLNEIYKGNERMIELINSLLDVSRLELGTLVLESENLDLIEIAESVIKELNSEIKKKNLVLNENYNKNEAIKYYSDPKFLRMIFQNLLSNAIKYTPEKGVIGLKIELKDNKIYINVTDTGYGIPKDQEKRIFTKLFRADNIIAKSAEGTGLGLYLVKRIVDKLNGEITFKSEENKGTTFNIILPINEQLLNTSSKPV